MADRTEFSNVFCKIEHKAHAARQLIKIWLQLTKLLQVLSGAGIVEQYLPKTTSDSDHQFRCARIRSTFARMWSLADNDPICGMPIIQK